MTAIPQFDSRVSHGRARLLCLQRRHREYLRLETQQVFAVFPHEGHNFRQRFRRLENIDLVEDDDHFFAPVTNAFQKYALALSKRAIYRGDEENQVAAWNKLFGESFVFAQYGVDTRGINDADIL